MTIFKKILIQLSIIFSFSQVHADSLRIVAVVGNDPITMLDFQERLLFTIATSGMEDSQELRQQLSSQVLTSLIDEKLKLRESLKYKIDVNDQEIAKDWERIEHQNQIPVGALLQLTKELGIRESVLKDQIRADLAWVKYISARFRPQIVVSDHDINQMLKKFDAGKTKPRYLLNEIFIAFDHASKKQDALITAQNIVKQLQKGAKFSALARELSQGFTAEQGGDLGWVMPDQLTKPIIHSKFKTLGNALLSLKAKQISEPFEAQDGFHIYFVREKLDPLDESQKDESYKIRQVFVPLNAQMDERQKHDVKRQFDHYRRQVNNPDDMLRIQKEVGGLQPPERWVQLSEFNQEIRSSLLKLGINQVTPIFDLDKGLTFMMLCEKKESLDITSKQKEMIKEEKIHEQLGMYSRRSLRDLKQATHIDVRL
ncbi:MAG: peptidylprolyl isomerase [Alphaproteobacteria bacterium]|nr:peptidylprolyl isomerase [Alphaproteobacteria bacterium]